MAYDNTPPYGDSPYAVQEVPENSQGHFRGIVYKIDEPSIVLLEFSRVYGETRVIKDHKDIYMPERDRDGAKKKAKAGASLVSETSGDSSLFKPLGTWN